MKAIYLLFTIVVLCLAVPVSAVGAGLPSVYTPLPSFPSQPAAGSFGVAASVLGDGRYILYDGDAVLIQDGVGVDSFTVAGVNYVGDPAFVAVSPDGHTVLLGSGFAGSGAIYSFDADAPADAGTPIATVDNHFWAVFLDETTLLVDSAAGVFPVFNAELDMIDLSPATPVVRKVVADKGGASAGVALSTDGRFAFATDGLTGDTRRFEVEDLRQAFDSNTPIAWTQGVDVGTFNTGGPHTVTDTGLLVFGGFIGTLEFVDESHLVSLGSVKPSPSIFTWSAVHNPITDELLAIGLDFSSFPTIDVVGLTAQGPFQALPVSGAVSLLLTAIVILVLGYITLGRAKYPWKRIP